MRQVDWGPTVLRRKHLPSYLGNRDRDALLSFRRREVAALNRARARAASSVYITINIVLGPSSRKPRN